MSKIRWGIVGTGWIARKFTEDLLLLPDHEVVAVGSRSLDTARTFAQAYGITRAYGSYEELAADAEVDVAYIATPHTLHFANTAMCLKAGRHVLVEKPITTRAADARELVALAREHRRFMLEAMWMRFNPIIGRLRELVAGGAIGDVQAVTADFSLAAPYDPEHRWWSPDLAGGGLLDLGIYPVTFATLLLGQPDSVQAVAAPAPTGVDANMGILFGYAQGAVALLHCGLMAESPQAASVIGTRGRIEVAPLFYRPTEMTLYRPGSEPEKITADIPGNGYTFQAEEVARCLREGLLESPVLPLEESVQMMALLDSITAKAVPTTD
jgi:predicted dehydrogenase